MEHALELYERVQHFTEPDGPVLSEFILTAYTVSPGSTGKYPGAPDYGITYSGTDAYVGRTVAVDPHIIPIGTPLYIDGIGWRLAEDIGGAVKGRHIDVLLDSDNEAFQFGVKRHIRVHMYVPKSGTVQDVMKTS